MSSYYRVLGVSRYADLGEIRRAYWSLARRVHRESRRGASASDLTEIQRAYDTLSDSGRRQMYDTRQSATQSSSAEELRAVRDVVPVLDPVLDDDVAKDFPSMATMARIVPRMRVAFFSAEAEVGTTHTTHVEVTSKEAIEGVRIPFHLPVRSSCPMCGGRGEIWTERCGVCAGTGAGHVSHQLHLPVPPGVRDGVCLRFSVTPPFSAEAHVELHIAIQ